MQGQSTRYGSAVHKRDANSKNTEHHREIKKSEHGQPIIAQQKHCTRCFRSMKHRVLSVVNRAELQHCQWGTVKLIENRTAQMAINQTKKQQPTFQQQKPQKQQRRTSRAIFSPFQFSKMRPREHAALLPCGDAVLYCEAE